MGRRSREHREAVEAGAEKPIKNEEVKRPWRYRLPFRISDKRQKQVDKAVKEIMKKKRRQNESRTKPLGMGKTQEKSYKKADKLADRQKPL